MSRRSLITVGMVGFVAVACGGTLPHPAYIAQPTGALVTVQAEPPPARVEYIPARPSASGAVWVDGEWSIRRGRWAWKLGRWVVPPPATSFAPWVFVRALDGTLYFAPGVFKDASGKDVAEPAPLAVAKADEIGVVAADGYTDLTGRTLRPQDVSPLPAGPK